MYQKSGSVYLSCNILIIKIWIILKEREKSILKDFLRNSWINKK